MRILPSFSLVLVCACGSSTKAPSPGQQPDTAESDASVAGVDDTDPGDGAADDSDGTGSGSGGAEDTAVPDTGSEVAPEPAWEDGTHDCVEGRYSAYAVQGWEVCVDAAVFADSDHGEAVLTLLSSDLAYILDVVPTTAVARLQGVRVWVEHSSDWAGAVYHPSASWLADNGYPTHWTESIQIANSANYRSWTAVQPAIVLHELSHAWHHQVLGYGDRSIADAYAAAMASGRYEEVEYAGGGTRQAYATTDEREYFAELTEAWFWQNDFYPFVRADLLEFDPLGAEVVESSWSR